MNVQTVGPAIASIHLWSGVIRSEWTKQLLLPTISCCFFRLSSELEGYDDVSNNQFSFVHGQTLVSKHVAWRLSTIDESSDKNTVIIILRPDNLKLNMGSACLVDAREWNFYWPRLCAERNEPSTRV